jgi:hypothetical protein
VVLSGHTFALAILLLVQLPGPAQRGDSMSAMIVGQVVDGESGRPLAGALVAVTGPPAADGGPVPRILTGSDGRFVFRGLRRGSYNLGALKSGFSDGAYGRTRPAGPSVPLTLADGERTGEPVLRLWRHASISGAVLDELGEHLVGVRVQAYRRTTIAGQRRYLPTGTALTDDRGIYRVGGLIPGDYIVGTVSRHVSLPLSAAGEMAGGGTGAAALLGVMPQASTQMIHLGGAGYVVGNGTATPPPHDQGRVQIYPSMFHPGAPAGDAATVIPLRAGEEHLSADLRLSPVVTVSVSGRAVGPDGPVNTTALRLVAANTPEIPLENDAIATLTDRNGAFTFPVVPTGHYRVVLLRGVAGPGARLNTEQNSVLWADMPVSVGEEDITGLAVSALAGVRVSGRVELEGSGSAGWPSLNTIPVLIEPADRVPGAAVSTIIVRVSDAGEFRSPPLPGGRYYVRIQNSPAGWMFKSATLEGRDAVDTPLEIAGDTPNVLITFTDRWSGVRGVVQNRQGPDNGAVVIVFPTDRETWGSSGANPRRVRTIRPGKSGEYSLNMPPGEYYILAVPDEQAADWQDPAFMDAASRAAVRVAIVEGERKLQDLRTREMR